MMYSFLNIFLLISPTEPALLFRLDKVYEKNQDTIFFFLREKMKTLLSYYGPDFLCRVCQMNESIPKDYAYICSPSCNAHSSTTDQGIEAPDAVLVFLLS